MGDTMTTTDHHSASADGPAGPSRWARLASLGLLMEASASALMLAAGLIWGLDIGDDAVFFALPIAAGLGGAWLVRRPRTIWKVVGIVLGVLIALMLFWTAFGLAEPTSFFDFVPGLLIVPGVLITLVAGIASIRSPKRGGASVRAAEGGERKAMTVVLAGVAVLAAVSAVLSVTGRESVSEADAANADVVVDLKDFEFDQDSYDLAGGGTILVKNSDPFLHTFTIEALDVDVEITPGSEKLITVPSEPGTYILYCRPHTGDPDDPSKDDMAAELTIG
jgi:plastocyanin